MSAVYGADGQRLEREQQQQQQQQQQRRPNVCPMEPSRTARGSLCFDESAYTTPRPLPVVSMSETPSDVSSFAEEFDGDDDFLGSLDLDAIERHSRS